MADKAANDAVLHDFLLNLTAEVTAAYAGRNDMAVGDIPNLIATVYQGFQKIAAPGAAVEARPEPAVPVKKSIFPDYIVCLEDGKKLKMLKRHLKTSYNMSVDQYRDRWNLPADYPVVAPNYAKHRSKLAKQIGLGTGRKKK